MRAVLGWVFWLGLLVFGGPLAVLGVIVGALLLGALIGALVGLFGGVDS